jgi:hypothetical protein
MLVSARWIGLVCVAAVLTGCGKSEAPPAAGGAPASPSTAVADGSGSGSNSAASQGGASESGAARAESPDSVVARFLEALRRGDRETVASLLTNAAREETVRLGYHINPPGDPSCKYEVGRVEMSDSAGDALVSSTWTNDVGNGELFSFEVVWIVKREAADWRVGGFAVTDPQSGQPLVFNFENLQEVFETKEQVEQAAPDANSPEMNSPAERQVQNAGDAAAGDALR